MWLKITQNYSPNFSKRKRQKKNIKYIIIHYTGMKNELSTLSTRPLLTIYQPIKPWKHIRKKIKYRLNNFDNLILKEK